jgi:hypothetical protein
MTVEGSLSSAMKTLTTLYSDETGGALALKVIKDQMDQQQQLIASLVQSSRIVASAAYDGTGKTIESPLPQTVNSKA